MSLLVFWEFIEKSLDYIIESWRTKKMHPLCAFEGCYNEAWFNTNRRLMSLSKNTCPEYHFTDLDLDDEIQG